VSADRPRPAPAVVRPPVRRPTYLCTGEVAALFQVSPKTVSAWARAGKLPCVRTLGGHARFPAEVVRELAAVEVAPPASPHGPGESR